MEKRRNRIKAKIRKKVRGTQERPRLVVFRSLKHIYAQLIDDVNYNTLLSVSSLNKDIFEKLKDSKDNIEKSKIIGKIVAEKALAQNCSKVVFDRNGYIYHGRVKALADGAREGGLVF
jgi:large subunit ribosomal protein L18